MKIILKAAAGLGMVLILAACRMPAPEPPLTVDEQAGTIIAATLTSQPEQATAFPGSPTNITATAVTAGSTPTRGVTVTITPTFSTPMLTVLEQTNCREGPGQEYQVVFTYLAGAQLEITGRYDPNNFWLVKSPESQTGSCWLWGEYVEVTGSYWAVPSVTPPPTATLPPPQAPAIQNWTYTCSGGDITFNLLWEDRAADETGYRIFRDGQAVAELPANSTSWTETTPIEAGEEVQYYLQVYGPGGNINTSIIKLSCG
jgi:hypothetical protein